MHVVYTEVQIDSGKMPEARQMLERELIPGVKQSPGFVKGMWFGDDNSGHGAVVFETRSRPSRPSNRSTPSSWKASRSLPVKCMRYTGKPDVRFFEVGRSPFDVRARHRALVSLPGGAPCSICSTVVSEASSPRAAAQPDRAGGGGQGLVHRGPPPRRGGDPVAAGVAAPLLFLDLDRRVRRRLTRPLPHEGPPPGSPRSGRGALCCPRYVGGTAGRYQYLPRGVGTCHREDRERLQGHHARAG